MLRPTRRELAQMAGLGFGAALAERARASCLPAPAVRWIVPHAPGGGFDTYSRLIAPFLEERLGARVQVDNVTGAAGLRGWTTLKQAKPDGCTVGILNIPGILMSALVEEQPIRLFRDFTHLGTISRSSHIWATSAATGFRSLEEALAAGRRGGLIFGANSTHSLGFLLPAMSCQMLGLKAHFVLGYPGSSDTTLAAIRGDVEVVSLSWENLVDQVESGDLRPLASVGQGPTESHPALRDLPVLTGATGLIARSDKATAQDAEALARFMRVGRSIGAPAGLPNAVERCLGDAVCQSLEACRAAARGLPVDPSCAEQTIEEIRAADDAVRRLIPLAREAMKKV